MHRISTSHFIKPQFRISCSQRIAPHNKPSQNIQSRSQTLHTTNFATATILSTLQSRTTLKTITPDICTITRLYFTRRRATNKSKSERSKVKQTQEAEDEEEAPQGNQEPEFTAKYKGLPDYNHYVQQALSLMESDPHEAITNAAMALEALNTAGIETQRVAEGFLVCKEIMATSYIRLKDYDSAQKTIDEMLKVHPKSYRAFVKRARIYYELNDFQHADEWFAKAIKENPTDGKTYVRRGFALIKLGKKQEAHEILEQGLRIIGEHESLLYWKALGLSGLQRNTEAAEALDLALQKPDATMDCHRLKAMVLQEAGKFEEAAEAAEVGVQKLQKLQRHDDKLLETLWSIQGACYLNIGKFKEAIESLQHLPLTAQGSLMLGQCYYEFKEYEIAVDYFTQAISLAGQPSEQAVARFRKALTLFQMERTEEAKEQFTQALELGLQPYYYDLFTAKGHRVMELQKAPQVLSFLEAMAGPNYEDPRVQVIRGIVLIKTGKIGEAITVLNKAAESGCDPAIVKELQQEATMESGKYAMQRLAKAYALQSTDTAQAIAIYEKILGSVAAHVSSAIYKTCVTELAKCSMKIQHYKKAEQCAQLGTKMGVPEAYVIYADALFYQGKFAESLKAYDNATQAISPYLSVAKRMDPENAKLVSEGAKSNAPKFEPLFSHKDIQLDKNKYVNRVMTFNPDFFNAMYNKATAHFARKEFSKVLQTCQGLEEILVPVAESHEKVISETMTPDDWKQFAAMQDNPNLKERLENIQIPNFQPEVEQSVEIMQAVRGLVIRITKLQAVTLASSGQKDFALKLYDRCIEMQASLDNYLVKIQYLMEEKNYEDVVDTCQHALMHGDLSKEDTREILEICARVCLMLNKHDDAIEQYENLLKVSKKENRWKVMFQLGVINRKIGNNDTALKSFNAALTYQTSSNIPAEYLRGIALEKAKIFMIKGLYEKAIKQFEDFVSITQKENLLVSHGFTLRWNMAYCYYQLNDFQKMQTIANGLVTRFSENPVSHFVMGLALQGLQKYSEALQFFDKSLELNPNQPDVENAKLRLVQKLAGTANLGLHMNAPPQVSMEHST